MTRLLISGGPGSGCSSTALALGERLGLPVFDSDTYFHKPTEPPFQEHYAPEERRAMLGSALSAHQGWILSGSVATWGLEQLGATHGVFLNVPGAERLRRLLKRQRVRFGSRIDPGGDMHTEHSSFMEWAGGYEVRTGPGRNKEADSAFLRESCARFLELTREGSLDEVAAAIVGFLA